MGTAQVDSLSPDSGPSPGAVERMRQELAAYTEHIQEYIARLEAAAVLSRPSHISPATPPPECKTELALLKKEIGYPLAALPHPLEDAFPDQKFGLLGVLAQAHLQDTIADKSLITFRTHTERISSTSRSRDISPFKHTSQKTSLLRPAQRRKVLPMYLEIRRKGAVYSLTELFEATADTGSDENAMDWPTFKTLGLTLIQGKHVRKEFTLANGKSFKSMGQVQVNCSFARDTFKLNYSVRFNVFSRLAAPVIIGKEFLDATETMTLHQDRLTTKEESDDGLLRVMHFNRPNSRIHCSVDGRALLANADTGAEMNLVSPSFMSKTGRWRRGLNKENLQIMLADGSSERITASFEGSISLDGYQGRSDVNAKFYVLPGLTSEALIGEDTLDEVDVFRKHFDAFVHDFEDDDHISLNIIKWLTERELRVVNALARKSAADERGTTAATSLPDTALTPRAFRAALADADARECHRCEQAQRRIGALSGRDRTAALVAEQVRATRYQTERARCLALHQQRINAQRT